MTIKLIALFSALFGVIANINANASPIAAESLTIFNPHITSPTAAMTWRMGSTHNVTWDISHIPTQKKHLTGMILLGHAGSDSENLDIDHPLAVDFPIRAGHQLVTIPKNLEPRSDYFVVLFGDSGNVSPRFTIDHP